MRKELQRIRAEFDPSRYPFLATATPTDVDALSALLSALLQQLGRDERGAADFIAILRDESAQERGGAILPPAFAFPASITGAPHNIRIHYDGVVLRFAGLMTAAQRNTLLTDPALAAVTGIPAYQAAIAEFHERPRLALKFLKPAFTAPLSNLPAAVDFSLLADTSLALRISFDAQRRELQLNGLLSSSDKDALDALSADPDYLGEVNSLFLQPALVVAPDDRIWLTEADLAFPLRDLADPTADHLAANMVTAIERALAYLTKTTSDQTVVDQFTAQLALNQATAQRLLQAYPRLPETLLAYFTGAFVSTNGVVDRATLGKAFDACDWAHRVAAMLARWKIPLQDWELLADLTASAQLLDPLTLPLNPTEPVASAERLLRTSRLLRVRDALPESAGTFLSLLNNLRTGAYASAADFAIAAETVCETWPAADIEALSNHLDAAYPNDYLLAETWERLQRAFGFMDALGCGATNATSFAQATMQESHAKTAKALLRGKFGSDTWLVLCAEIQDVLRERKRDALVAYLLSRPMPAGAPTGKWENSNDLYAYCLIDVEMCSCQLTSRIVQATGSIQLLVQRCFMGLEPEVEVDADGADGDSAWRWWRWMRKYRVWEVNRKVYLWPENWIEPELKKDRSSFFRDLENELLQNEVTTASAEAAFAAYLEKLRGVAQLEIVGHYQEDDGDNAIVHVFGRTPGAQPHLYYYRRYDYRQWTPWERVDLDIEGDYLIPAVIGSRLFLFWPIFSEVPDETANDTVKVPRVDLDNDSSFKVDKTKKCLQMRMAVSDYRNGKWTPRRVSTDYAESSYYTGTLLKKHYEFYPIDRSEIDGRFFVKFSGNGLAGPSWAQVPVAGLYGACEVSGCKGVPELSYGAGYFTHAVRPESASVGHDTAFLKWKELADRTDRPEEDFTLESVYAPAGNGARYAAVLQHTPDLFSITPPWHLSYIDRLLLDGLAALGSSRDDRQGSVGSWLPFFYQDKARSFFVLPVLAMQHRGRPATHLGSQELSSPETTDRFYYPEVKKALRQWETYIEGQVKTWAEGLHLTSSSVGERHQLDTFLWDIFGEQAGPPDPNGSPPEYTPARIEQVQRLLTRWVMRYFHYYLGAFGLGLYQYRRFHFKNHYHPFVCDFAKLLYNPLKGISGLMDRNTQLKDSGFSFERSYQPTAWVVEQGSDRDYPKEVVDFDPDGAYASYNWELFFHAPLLIANTLSRNQRFEEARDWYHYIFNPIGVDNPTPGGSPMSRYWITKPFFQATDQQYQQQRIDAILRMLAGDSSVPGYSAQARAELEKQVLDWRTWPFEPHRIANYRTVAYQKTVVMKYLDNLIAWADNLFRQDSMESLNEATQLYILAAEILGPKPRSIPPRAIPPLESFNELEFQFDAFSNALIDIENLVPALPEGGGEGTDPAPLPMLYFCIPRNEKMLAYWDTIADRLYKLRHCMNIDGVVRQLALFEPPIDPGALVKAVAGGADLGAALSDLSAPLPLYRFFPMLRRAEDVCSDLVSLGAALLAALEKKDAEAVAQLRQGHEIRLLDAVTEVRKKQVEEARETLQGLKKNKEVVTIRRDHYRSIEKINAGERLHQGKLGDAQSWQERAQATNIAASVAHMIPSFSVGINGAGGSPNATVSFGGSNVGGMLQAIAGGFTFAANSSNYDANMASINAGHDRRWDDWKLQEHLADKEIEQIDKSIAAAELKIKIAEKDYENHTLQMEHAKEALDFMRGKYTDDELYSWQIGQISSVFFRSYRLAYDLAKRAERCLRFELGMASTSYINFGYWDGLKKGLGSGESLRHDLRRLESAYLERNRREFELGKDVSIARLDPMALVMLRETGRCTFRMPEEAFDLDFPGHYFRRLKSVSVTIPCIAGPYTTVSATLRLLKNSVRVNTEKGSGYARNTDEEGAPVEDGRFVENTIPVNAIAISRAQNDSGMFELDFRDERYLPFEGAGAISEWSLELFNDSASNNPDPSNPDFGRPLRQFDYSTISDVVVHLKYTAREDAGVFRNDAIAHLRDYFEADGSTHSSRLFDLKREFPSHWHRFVRPAGASTANVFELGLDRKLFRLMDEGKTLKINAVTLLCRAADAGSYQAVLSALPEPPPAGSNVMSMARLNQYGGLHVARREVEALSIELPPDSSADPWRITLTRPGGGDLQIDSASGESELEGMWLLLEYEWN
ncbi:MAG: hypothetical protein E6Q88_08345 [Lysobacteraceae bacterium]|nr:MAG: hypothetical protein E6Q88_08345 [Xanthomonadaceae bacterium]